MGKSTSAASSTDDSRSKIREEMRDWWRKYYLLLLPALTQCLPNEFKACCKNKQHKLEYSACGAHWCF